MTVVRLGTVEYDISTIDGTTAYYAALRVAHEWKPWMDRGLRACFLSRWRGDPKRCRWCDEPLTGRQRRWCSRECSLTYDRNHVWNVASRRRKTLDGDRCVECDGRTPAEAFELAIERGDYAHARRYRRIEVHHLTPILGRHGEIGCHHHLDGLRTLCGYHHVAAHHGEPVAQLRLLA